MNSLKCKILDILFIKSSSSYYLLLTPINEKKSYNKETKLIYKNKEDSIKKNKIDECEGIIKRNSIFNKEKIKIFNANKDFYIKLTFPKDNITSYIMENTKQIKDNKDVFYSIDNSNFDINIFHMIKPGYIIEINDSSPEINLFRYDFFDENIQRYYLEYSNSRLNFRFIIYNNVDINKDDDDKKDIYEIDDNLIETIKSNKIFSIKNVFILEYIVKIEYIPAYRRKYNKIYLLCMSAKSQLLFEIEYVIYNSLNEINIDKSILFRKVDLFNIILFENNGILSISTCCLSYIIISENKIENENLLIKGIVNDSPLLNFIFRIFNIDIFQFYISIEETIFSNEYLIEQNQNENLYMSSYYNVYLKDLLIIKERNNDKIEEEDNKSEEWFIKKSKHFLVENQSSINYDDKENIKAEIIYRIYGKRIYFASGRLKSILRKKINFISICKKCYFQIDILIVMRHRKSKQELKCENCQCLIKNFNDELKYVFDSIFEFESLYPKFIFLVRVFDRIGEDLLNVNINDLKNFEIENMAYIINSNSDNINDLILDITKSSSYFNQIYPIFGKIGMVFNLILTKDYNNVLNLKCYEEIIN